MRSCVRRGEREKARRTVRGERSLSAESPHAPLRHTAQGVEGTSPRVFDRISRPVCTSETDAARKGAREEKKREVETRKRYIGAIKGDRQGHRGSEERDTGRRGRETEEAAIEWERYGFRGSETEREVDSGAVGRNERYG